MGIAGQHGVEFTLGTSTNVSCSSKIPLPISSKASLRNILESESDLVVTAPCGMQLASDGPILSVSARSTAMCISSSALSNLNSPVLNRRQNLQQALY